MLVDHPIEFLPEGSTKPLLASDENENKVVIKAMIRPTYGKILLNEYLAGNLARSIGLPWPKVQIATLGNKVVRFMQENSLQPVSMDCVAIDFIEDLEKVPWPNPPNGQIEWGGNFHLLPDENRKHLSLYFDNPEKESVFYGKALFDIWLFFQDTKYDTLFIRPTSSPFFLDGSHALGGSEWEFEQMDYSHTMFSPKSPYLEGILTELDLYNEWIERIELLPLSYIKSLFDSIPSSWRILKVQSDFLFDLLAVKRKIFVAYCREEIEWQRFTKDLL